MGVVLAHVMTHLAHQAPGPFGPEGSRAVCEDWFYHVACAGAVGLCLFFVISGFILTLPFADAALNGRPPPSLRRYYLRRVSRLEPPYIISLTILLFCYVVVARKPLGQLAPHFLATAFYCHSQIYGAPNPYVALTWTLEIEVQFYILAPFLAMIFRVRRAAARRSLLAGLMLGALLMAQLLAPGSPRYQMSILAYLQYFLAGFLLVELYLTVWKEEPRHRFAWDAASLFAWAGIFIIGFANRWYFLLPIAIIFACAGAFRGRWVRSFLGWRYVWTIGGMCYTIYLYHYQMISGPMRLTIGLFNPARHLWVNYLLQCAVLLLPLLVACTIAYVFLERPFMERSWAQKSAERILELFGHTPLLGGTEAKGAVKAEPCGTAPAVKPVQSFPAESL
jgi:peptidoglycan/LPS O-acetylase OafA/YrhL